MIPESTNPGRIAQNIEVFDVAPTAEQMDALDALGAGLRGGPEPEDITLETLGRDILEASTFLNGATR